VLAAMTSGVVSCWKSFTEAPVGGVHVVTNEVNSGLDTGNC
jgi:hypothetical protein